MGKKLIIVESPNKVRHIQEFVGRDYIVMASVGHIRQINDSGKYKIGVDYDNDFKTDWVVSPKKKEVVSDLKKAAKEADVVYLASDDDNEGEAIAWHLKEVLKVPASKIKRAVFREITKPSVLAGLEAANYIDENKASSALTRAKWDKIIGYRLSPILLTKCGGKSGGRVQSVALLLVGDREEEIQAFKSEDFYEIYLTLSKDSGSYRSQYKGTDDKKITQFNNIEEAEQVLAECTPGNYYVRSIESKNRTVSANLPFITSSLQQECGTKLGYSPKKTMEYAQNLFHNGLITYMRTDSTRLSDEFISTARDFIINNYGKDFYYGVKISKKKKGTTENVQDAHEAIRCTDVSKTPSSMKDSGELAGPELRVYTLIWNRCVASLMSNAIVEDTNVNIYNGKHKFLLTGHRAIFPGFRLVYGEDDRDIIPAFNIDEHIIDLSLDNIKKSTKPPAPYNEVSIVKKLEELKIGRPSTYAGIVDVITDTKRGYTKVENKTIRPTEKGMLVYKFLKENFNPIINYKYTAELEAKLDQVSNGEINSLELLHALYNDLVPVLRNALKADSMKPKAVLTDTLCPKCGKPLAIRKGPYGDFLGCSGFPRCHYIEKKETLKKQEITDFIPCPSCKTGHMIMRIATKGRSKGKEFYACSNYPSCKTAMTVENYEKLKRESEINPLAIDGDNND